MPESPGARGWRRTQVWLPVAYAAVAGAWVLWSDAALLSLAGTPGDIARWSVLKGWGFVAATAGLLHVLLRGSERARDEAMRRLAEREAQSRRLVEASPDAMLIQAGFQVLFANEAAVRLFGAPDAAALAGRPVFDLIHPGDHEGVRLRTTAAASGTTFPPLALRRMRRLDGTVLRCEVALAPLGTPEHPDAIVVTIRDVTGAWLLQQERDRVNAALRLLSSANEALVRAADESALMAEVCRAAVEQGGFRVAFVGLVEPGDERVVRLAAKFGADAGHVEGLQLSWREETPGGRGPTGEALRTGAPAVVNDVAAEARLGPMQERLRAIGVAAIAAFPLLQGEARLGVLALLAPEAGAFIPPVVALLKQLADDLAIGLAALRTRAALDEERRTLQAILDDINDPIGVMDREGRLVRVNGPFAAQAGCRPEELLGQRLSGDVIPAGELAGVQAALEQAWRGEGPVVHVNHHVGRDGSRRLVEWTNTVVRGADGAPRFLVGLGHDVTERTQSEARLRESREQLRALAGRLQTVREEEKARIARDLHDELGQLLTGLKMDLRWLENRLGDAPSAGPGVLDRVVAASELVDQTVASVQRLASELRPGALDRLGLVPALRQEARRFQQRTGITCDTDLDEAAPEPASEVATALYRICQESMTNVSRHAGARRVLVRLRAEPGALVLRVEDDGVGLDGAAMGPEALGLLGMTERATALGGTVRFTGRDGGGTAVEARIPAAPAAPRHGGTA